MSKRKRNYIESIIVLIVFTAIIFIFDLPKVNFITIGVIAAINILFYEIFGTKK